jgi:hypothetical protein
MASLEIKKKILKHLSAKNDTWASTVAHVSQELGAGTMPVEEAMKDMVEKQEIERTGYGRVPTYQPGGAVEGKYSGFNQRRLEMENVTKTETFEENPELDPLSPYKAV